MLVIIDILAKSGRIWNLIYDRFVSTTLMVFMVHMLISFN